MWRICVYYGVRGGRVCCCEYEGSTLRKGGVVYMLKHRFAWLQCNIRLYRNLVDYGIGRFDDIEVNLKGVNG